MDARARRRAEAEREHQLAQGRTRGHAPPGWPPAVLPVDVDTWTDSAVTWLLDHGRPEWRLNPTLRHQPVVLARFACELAHANVTAARTAWLDLPLLENDVAAGVRALLELEGPRLAAHADAVDLVDEALRGHRWTKRL